MWPNSTPVTSVPIPFNDGSAAYLLFDDVTSDSDLASMMDAARVLLDAFLRTERVVFETSVPGSKRAEKVATLVLCYLALKGYVFAKARYDNGVQVRVSHMQPGKDVITEMTASCRVPAEADRVRRVVITST